MDIQHKKNETKNETKNGLSSFIKTLEDNPLLFPNISDIKEQIETLKNFQNGQISYSEMRSRCG